MHHESILSDLNTNEVVYDNDNSYLSNNDLKNKIKHEDDVNLLSDMNIDEDKLEDNDDRG